MTARRTGRSSSSAPRARAKPAAKSACRPRKWSARRSCWRSTRAGRRAGIPLVVAQPCCASFHAAWKAALPGKMPALPAARRAGMAYHMNSSRRLRVYFSLPLGGVSIEEDPMNRLLVLVPLAFIICSASPGPARRGAWRAWR